MILDRRRSGLLLVLLTVGAGSLFLSIPAFKEKPAPVPRPQTRDLPYLDLPAKLSRPLRGGETSSFRLRLKQGEAFSVILPTARYDLTLCLRAPSGDELIRVDSANGLRDSEVLYALVETTGDHVLEIRSDAGPDRTVRYRLEISPPRPASDQDRLRAAAMSLFSKGERLLDEDDEQARRQAADSYYQALGYWEKAGDPEREAATRFRLARALQRDYRWRAAEVVVRRALEEVRARRSPIAEAGLLDLLARSRLNLNELEEAQDLFQRSLDRFRQVGYRAGEADLLANLAIVERRRGDFQAGIGHDLEALDIRRALGGLKEQATLLNNLGEIFLVFGPPEQARDYFEQSLEVSTKAGSPRHRALALRGKGTVHGQLRQIDVALASLNESIEIWRALGDHPAEVVSRVRLGDVFAGAGRYKDARELYEHALRLARESEFPLGEGMALGNLGRLMDLQKREQEGLLYFSQARAIFERVDPSTLPKIAFGQAQALLDLGELEKARLTVEEAIDGFESFQGPYQRIAAASDRRSSYELYVDILMRLREKAATETERRDFESQAFEAAERARFRTLLDDVGENLDSTRSNDPELLRRKVALENRLNELELRRWVLHEAPEKVLRIDREVRELQAHLAVMRRDLQAGSERALPKPLSLAEVQGSLDPDSLLLVYFLGRDRSLLWEVARDRFTTHLLGDRSAIEDLANQVKKALSIQSSPPEWRKWARPLRDLSELVLSPVADRLKETTLIVDPDGALNVVPFAALLDPRTLQKKGLPGDGREGPRFLVFDHETVVVPSVSLIAARREVLAERPSAPGVIAVLADPVFDRSDPRVPERLRTSSPASEFSRLEGTEDEADAILAEVPRGRTLDARSFRANRTLATSPELGQYQILHFATHGWLRDRPDLSGVVLSLIDESGRPQDGFLRAFEIYDLDLSADLVVLSACETGLGSDQGGLVRGFLNAGAKRVVATLWPVKDRSTAQLMASFYRSHLSQGLTTPAALRRAQLDLAGGTTWSSPYYWAGFVLNGDWN